MNFSDDAARTAAQLDQYITRSAQGLDRAIDQAPIQEIIAGLGLDTHIQDGGLTGDRLQAFVSDYLARTTRLHHPGFFAHQVAAPHPAGGIGAMIDGVTNNAMAIYEMGPAAAAIEYVMINLILEKIGWPPMPLDTTRRLTFSHGAGVLTHGGSLANLTALLVARHARHPEIRESGSPGNLTVLVPASSHYSVAKAAGIMGMGQANVTCLPVDKMGRVIPDRLEEAWAEARDKGKTAIALVANACATATGLYDPIDEMADFCTEKGLWFHVDGAHGGCALFSPKQRHCLAGVSRADSFILDAHKMLRTPTVCAAVLVKEARHLDLVFEETASYLFHDKAQPGFDFIQQTVECTKAGLGLKFFLSFAASGEAGMAAFIDQTFELAMAAHDLISQEEGFSCPCRPEANILCFRIEGSDADQLRIRDRLIAEGTFYISSTELDGKRYLRIVIMSPATTLDHIRELVRSIRAATPGH